MALFLFMLSGIDAPSCIQPKRELLGYMAFTSFRNAYQEPALDEGFSEIKQVNFVFDGSEEERRRWGMWLQIEGK